MAETITTKKIPLCTVEELPLGLGRAFTVGETPIAVFRSRSGRIFAVDGFCPHKNGPLADGMLAGDDQVVCPYHTYRYDSTTGECDQPNACSIKVYPVVVEGKKVHVTI